MRRVCAQIEIRFDFSLPQIDGSDRVSGSDVRMSMIGRNSYLVRILSGLECGESLVSTALDENHLRVAHIRNDHYVSVNGQRYSK